MTTPAESPEYALASAAIAALSADAQLAPLTLPEVLDNSSAVGRLALAAAQGPGCIAVMPQDAITADSESTSIGLLRVRCALGIFSTRADAAGASRIPSLYAVTGRAAAVITAANWSTLGIPFLRPRIESISPLPTADFEGLANLIGRLIIFSRIVNYKAFYGIADLEL